MTGHSPAQQQPAASGPWDSRAVALAAYLREKSGAFSLSADTTDSMPTARAGMVLLDAARLAERLGRNDPIVVELSEAGLFESMPGGRARVVETPEVLRAIQRPLAGDVVDGAGVLAAIVSACRRW